MPAATYYGTIRSVVENKSLPSAHFKWLDNRIKRALERVFWIWPAVLAKRFLWTFFVRITYTIYARLLRNRISIKAWSASLSDQFDEATQRGGLGEKILLAAAAQVRRGRHRRARILLGPILVGLEIAIAIHLAASQRARAIRAIRITNALFRPLVRARRQPLTNILLHTLLTAGLYNRVRREVATTEVVDSLHINLITGIACVYARDIPGALHFLGRAVEIEPDSGLAQRMLGRALLLAGNYTEAAHAFAESVRIDPKTVMAHQNYAGRYDILGYQPKAWELAAPGTLLIYDNLLQVAEDFFLQGRFAESFVMYQKALRYQHDLPKPSLPDSLLSDLARLHPAFDRERPIRLLPYEWVTQFGHIGLLDSYIKMSRLGMIPDANYVLLAPADKVASEEYLPYWSPYFCIVREQELVDELFPYQRYFGDQFMAVPGEGPSAEPWTRAAARAQIAWARAGKPPLLALSPYDRMKGEQAMERLGLPRDAWYVGLHVREGGFHRDGRGTISEHRSAEIEDYFEAISEITGRGGYVVRLGDATMKPLPPMTNVIDYALSAEKSPRTDLFWLATSRFVIGTTSGLTTAAISFGTSMLLANCISNDWQLWSGDTDFIVKPLYDRRQRRYLTFGETYRQPVQGYLINNEMLSRRGYEPHANTATDIRDAVRYKLEVMCGERARADDSDPLMQRYRAALAQNPDMFGAARPALPFLEAHPELLAATSEVMPQSRAG